MSAHIRSSISKLASLISELKRVEASDCKEGFSGMEVARAGSVLSEHDIKIPEKALTEESLKRFLNDLQIRAGLLFAREQIGQFCEKDQLIEAISKDRINNCTQIEFGVGADFIMKFGYDFDLGKKVDQLCVPFGFGGCLIMRNLRGYQDMCGIEIYLNISEAEDSFRLVAIESHTWIFNMKEPQYPYYPRIEPNLPKIFLKVEF